MHEPQERATARAVAVRGGLPLPALPRTRPAVRRRADARPRFAAAPILLVALVAGVVLRMDRIELLGLRPRPVRPDSVFVLNLVVLIYRLVAIVDAYRVAEYMNAHAASRRRPRRPARGCAATRCRSPACSPSSW